MAASAATFAIFAAPLARLFSEDPAVIAVAVVLLRVAALFQLSDGAQAIGGGCLRGAADTRAAFLVNLFGHWVVGLPVGLALAFRLDMGARGLWLGLSASLTVVAVFLAVRFFSERWRPRAATVAAAALVACVAAGPVGCTAPPPRPVQIEVRTIPPDAARAQLAVALARAASEPPDPRGEFRATRIEVVDVGATALVYRGKERGLFGQWYEHVIPFGGVAPQPYVDRSGWIVVSLFGPLPENPGAATPCLWFERVDDAAAAVEALESLRAAAAPADATGGVPPRAQ
jgi:hypothetical protein